MKTLIIAEAGVNHNGDEALALALVDKAAECGADIVKFQTFKADKLVRKGAAKAEYQQRTTGSGDQHSMLRSLELSDDLHYKLLERCRMRGIEFMSTAFDEDSANFLVDLGMARLKIPSGELTNHPLLAHLAEKIFRSSSPLGCPLSTRFERRSRSSTMCAHGLDLPHP